MSRDMTKVKLLQPIIFDDKKITELYLRVPTIDDIAEIGYPFLMIIDDNGTDIKIQPKAVLKYAAKLGGIPASSLKNLTIDDFSNLQTAVISFFES